MLLLPPALAVLAYLLWSSGPTGVASRGYFASSLQMWTHEVQVTHPARRLNWVLAYFGLFVSPLLLMYAPTLLRHLGRLDRRGKAVVAGSVLLVSMGYAYEWCNGSR